MDEQINQTPEQAPQTPQNPPSFKKPVNWFLITTIGLGVIIFVLAGTVVYLWQQKSDSSINTNQPSLAIAPVPTQEPSNQQQLLPEHFIRVAWLPAWVPLPKLSGDDTPGIERVRAGKIIEGNYKNYDLNIVVEPGLGTSYSHYIVDNGTIVNLYDKNIKILGIDDMPDTIAMAGTNYTLKKNWVASQPFSEIKKILKVFTDPRLGEVYLTDNGCFVVELPDHTAVTYDFVIPFVNKDTRVLEVTYSDSLKNQDPYTYTKITGCGALCMYLAQVDDAMLKPQERLMEAGKTSNGETLYEFKDTNATELKDLYNNENTVAYYNTDSGYQQLQKSKYSYAEFLSYHPLLYWKDPIGRWIEIKNERFQIAAEMCKPVIYLYPQKATEMSVKVAPNGGFTFTQPLYGNGWHVVAYPDGTVKDISDGQTYPYLFWEGIGLNYPEQDSGFVIARADLDNFLSEKLAVLGLKGREADDFKTYWTPRLKGLNRPYYKITFLKKEQMDEIAPLDLSVKPTSVIRVMMTAKGMDAFENMPLQELPVPAKRVGFTLVEWGGTILK